MEKTKCPTEEQAERFWRWCGLYHSPQVIRGGHVAKASYWSYQGRDVSGYLGSPPLISLDNLFEYAVPKLGGGTDLSVGFREVHWANGQVFTECVILRNFAEVGRASLEGLLGGMSAQTFFWAVYDMAKLEAHSSG